MGHSERPKAGIIGKTLLVYLGSAWVFIEAINFLIDTYDWNTTIIDALILLVIFGLPALLIYIWFNRRFTWKAIILQVVNGILALTIIGFTLINPGQLNPTQLRLLKFKTNQKELAESIKSIVILPFDNFTGDDNLEYLVSGIHSSMITDMGRLGALKVMCSTTANSFKGSNKSVRRIASELDVDAAIEASISCLGGDSICIQTRLIYASGEEQQLWVQDFRVGKDQILNFYSDIAKKISEEVNIVLTPEEERIFGEDRPVNPEAYDAYLMGMFYWEKWSMEGFQKALENLERAIEIDPEWGPPYAGIAAYWIAFRQFNIAPSSVTIPKIYEYLDKAIELDPNSANTHYVNALTAVWTGFNWEKGEREFLKSLEINPNDAMCHVYYAHLLMILRRPQEAIQQVSLALELDPLRPVILGLAGVVFEVLGDVESAVPIFEKALSIEPGNPFILPHLNGIRFNAPYLEGDYAQWFENWGNKVTGHWKEGGRQAVLNTFLERGHIAGIEEMFRMNEKYGNEECFMADFIKIERYLKLKDYERVMDFYEEWFEIHDPDLPYITRHYDDMSGNARYRELLKKLNLW